MSTQSKLRPGRSKREPSNRTPSPTVPRKLLEPADFVRIPVWVGMKALAVVPISVLLRLATLRGTLDSLFSPKRARVAAALERNLEQTPMADEPGRVARRYFQFRRRERLTRLWPLIRGFAGAERVEVEGLRHLDEAFAGGQGAILVTARYGYARLIKPILRLHGRSVLLVGAPRTKEIWPGIPRSGTRLGRFVYSRILRLPKRSHWRDTLGTDLPATMNVRPHLASLARNKALIIVADGRNAQKLRPVSVLGKDVNFAPGPLSMARATGAPALPTFAIDDLEGTSRLGFRIVIHPPLELQVTADANADLEVNLGRFAAVYAEQLRAQPHLSREMCGKRG
jgi:lauroyl/myristoyl acyltransferase